MGLVGDQGLVKACLTAGLGIVWAHCAVGVGVMLMVMVGAASNAQAQDNPGKQSAAANARAEANDDMDRLRREIRMLTELRDTQRGLREWNELRVAAGEPRAVLDRELCAGVKQWCAVLPGTFGRQAAGGARR